MLLTSRGTSLAYTRKWIMRNNIEVDKIFLISAGKNVTTLFAVIFRKNLKYLSSGSVIQALHIRSQIFVKTII